MPYLGGDDGGVEAGGGLVCGDGGNVCTELGGGGEEGAGIADVEGVEHAAAVGGEVVLGRWEGVRAGD